MTGMGRKAAEQFKPGDLLAADAVCSSNANVDWRIHNQRRDSRKSLQQQENILVF